MKTVTDFILGGSKIIADSDNATKLKDACCLQKKKSFDEPRQCIKNRDITLLTKVCLVKVMVLFSCHVWMWELYHKEGWAPKNSCFWTMVLEKEESFLDCKEIKPVNPKGNQSWIFIAKTDDEAEAPILRPPDVKSWLIRKDPDAGKDWKQEEKGTSENEMVGWHHWLKGHEFEQTRGDCEGQESLAYCS